MCADYIQLSHSYKRLAIQGVWVCWGLWGQLSSVLCSRVLGSSGVLGSRRSSCDVPLQSEGNSEAAETGGNDVLNDTFNISQTAKGNESHIFSTQGHCLLLSRRGRQLFVQPREETISCCSLCRDRNKKGKDNAILAPLPSPCLVR